MSTVSKSWIRSKMDTDPTEKQEDPSERHPRVMDSKQLWVAMQHDLLEVLTKHVKEARFSDLDPKDFCTVTLGVLTEACGQVIRWLEDLTKNDKEAFLELASIFMENYANPEGTAEDLRKKTEEWAKKHGFDSVYCTSFSPDSFN